MKSMKSFLIEFLILFLLINILIVSFLTIDVPEAGFNAKSVMNIIVRFGIIFSIPVALILTGAHTFFNKVAKNAFLKILTIVIVAVLLYFIYYVFLWYVGISGLIDDPFVK